MRADLSIFEAAQVLRVCATKCMAELEIAEVLAKIRLLLMNANELDFEDDGVGGSNGSKLEEKLTSFVKTLV